MVHYKRPNFWQQDGIALAYRPSALRLLDTEFVDLNDLATVFNKSTYKRNNQAMFCLFEHLSSRKKVVAGNLHLHFNPEKDFIKFAQASYVMERGAAFVRKHSDAIDSALPIFICGDYNSTPVSSVMSLFHDEDIEAKQSKQSQQSRWALPREDAGNSG